MYSFIKKNTRLYQTISRHYSDTRYGYVISDNVNHGSLKESICSISVADSSNISLHLLYSETKDGYLHKVSVPSTPKIIKNDNGTFLTDHVVFQNSWKLDHVDTYLELMKHEGLSEDDFLKDKRWIVWAFFVGATQILKFYHKHLCYHFNITIDIYHQWLFNSIEPMKYLKSIGMHSSLLYQSQLRKIIEKALYDNSDCFPHLCEDVLMLHQTVQVDAHHKQLLITALANVSFPASLLPYLQERFNFTKKDLQVTGLLRHMTDVDGNTLRRLHDMGFTKEDLWMISLNFDLDTVRCLHNRYGLRHGELLGMPPSSIYGNIKVVQYLNEVVGVPEWELICGLEKRDNFYHPALRNTIKYLISLHSKWVFVVCPPGLQLSHAVRETPGLFREKDCFGFAEPGSIDIYSIYNLNKVVAKNHHIIVAFAYFTRSFPGKELLRQSRTRTIAYVDKVYDLNVVSTYEYLKKIGLTKRDFIGDGTLLLRTYHLGLVGILQYLHEHIGITRYDMMDCERYHEIIQVVINNKQLNTLRYLQDEMLFIKDDFSVCTTMAPRTQWIIDNC